VDLKAIPWSQEASCPKPRAVSGWLLDRWLRRHEESGNETVFKASQLVSSAAVSLGHGTNDAQKTMRVIAALLVRHRHLHASGDKLPIPLWVVLAAHTAIALGTISGGWRIVHTMGQRITELRPARGMAAETGTAVALFGSTALGRRCRPPTRWSGRSPGWEQSPGGCR
jgi:PiT family inorganic phosphate transporter